MILLGRYDMKKTVVLIMVLAFLVQGCAAGIAHHRQTKKREIWSKVTVGTKRKEITKTLGKPIESEGKFIDRYSVCVSHGREVGADFHIVMDIATLGLWEIFGTPAELAKSCKDKRDIVVIYDENDIVSAILTKANFLKIKKVYVDIISTVEIFKKNENLALLYFNDSDGWFFVDKKNIDCGFQNNFIKFYVKLVLPLDIALEMKKNENFEEVPIYSYSTVLIDVSNNQFREYSCLVYNGKGEVIKTLPDEGWIEIYPETYVKILCDLCTHYCINKLINEYKEKHKPELHQYFKNRKMKI